VITALPADRLTAVLSTSRRRATAWASVTAAVEERLGSTGRTTDTRDEEIPRCG
jgi:hypothetical protein